MPAPRRSVAPPRVCQKGIRKRKVRLLRHGGGLHLEVLLFCRLFGLRLKGVVTVLLYRLLFRSRLFNGRSVVLRNHNQLNGLLGPRHDGRESQRHTYDHRRQKRTCHSHKLFLASTTSATSTMAYARASCVPTCNSAENYPTNAITSTRPAQELSQNG